ncbi:MAG: hypothetical protein OQL08_06695 [Gammaproteobacteria bacterium]|nr:hypothetical protein [Gammaproteobacteria bacterium]
MATPHYGSGAPPMSIIRFTHLQIGQQFDYQGMHYTKVAPLIASNNANGAQRMIPRSAAVTLLSDEQGVPAADHPIHPALAVLQRYHQTALAELQALSADETKVGAARARLERLRDELAAALR